MTHMIIEAVLISFCVGGAIGAMITLQLQHSGSKVEVHNDH